MVLTINNEVIGCWKSPNHASCPPLLLNISWCERTVRALALRIMTYQYFRLSPAAKANEWQLFVVAKAAGDSLKFTWGIIIPRNVIINRGAAEIDNHISRDDIFGYHSRRECNMYSIIPNRRLDPLFSDVLLLLNRPIMLRGDPKGMYS